MKKINLVLLSFGVFLFFAILAIIATNSNIALAFVGFAICIPIGLISYCIENPKPGEEKILRLMGFC